MVHRNVLARLAALVCLGVTALTAQAPTFKTRTEYVELDVVVTDKDDRPVRGLTKDDFEIVEQDRPQAIAGFQAIEIPAVRRTVADVKTAQPTKDVVTNVHPAIARQWVMVIDDLHIMATHVLHTKKLVQDFLEQIPEADAVAIVFTGRSDLSQDFTTDLGAEIRTVNRIKDALGFAPDLNDMMGPSAPVPAGARRQDVASTFLVMRNVANALVRSSYPRKAFVWVSEGSTFDLPPAMSNTQDMRSELDNLAAGAVFDEQIQIMKTLREAGVPVYSIDPRGPVDCTSYWSPCGGDPGSSHGARNQAAQLRTISENTGGRAFVGASDMPRAVRELIEDNSAFYLLGYYPDPLVSDGKFHGVDVRVRRPGLRVRARAGYAAPKDGAVSAAEARATLDEVLSAALPVSSLTLSASAAPAVRSDKGMRTAVTLEITYPELPPGTVNDTLEFGVIALDHDGKLKSQVRGSYKYSASIKPGQPVTYLVNAPIDLPAQPLTLRVGVSSQLLGRAASIHLPVEPITPGKSPMQIGGIVLGYAGRARETAVPAGALNGVVPIQPTLDRVFSATDVLAVFVPLYWRTVEGASLQKAAVVDISLVRDGQSVRTNRVEVQPTPTTGLVQVANGQITAAVPLRSLPSGNYFLRVDAHLAAGPAARKEIAFRIR